MDNNSVFIEKLRSSGLRPTKQRLEICKLLFDRKKTFHFTINYLFKILQKGTGKKISLATIYNTVHSFKEKGYLKEISVNKDKSYFDTNTSDHHHFLDINTNELIDLIFLPGKFFLIFILSTSSLFKSMSSLVFISRK